MLESTQAPSVFTATSAYSLAGVAGIALVATTAARALLPKNAPWQDRATFIWLVRGLSFLPFPFLPDAKTTPQTFDALIHFIFEGSFLALSTFGRTVNTSSGALAEMCASFSNSPLHFYFR